MKLIAILIATLLLGLSMSQIKLDGEKSKLTVTGTSSLHDWEMDVNEFKVSGDISDSKISNLLVEVTSESLKSGKSTMDKKAHDAVQSKDYPFIKFSASTLSLSSGQIQGPGILEIGGEKRDMNFQAEIVHETSTEMQLKGALSFKLTDFNIAPPTALFATLKTGDEVQVNYEIYLLK
ncbi:MAG: YceI family protein [Bacteroidota bacterium]